LSHNVILVSYCRNTQAMMTVKLQLWETIEQAQMCETTWTVSHIWWDNLASKTV